MTTLAGPPVRHTVLFTLRHEEGSPEADAFLTALRSLAEVDGSWSSRSCAR